MTNKQLNRGNWRYRTRGNCIDSLYVTAVFPQTLPIPSNYRGILDFFHSRSRGKPAVYRGIVPITAPVR